MKKEEKREEEKEVNMVLTREEAEELRAIVSALLRNLDKQRGYNLYVSKVYLDDDDVDSLSEIYNKMNTAIFTCDDSIPAQAGAASPGT